MNSLVPSQPPPSGNDNRWTPFATAATVSHEPPPVDLARVGHAVRRRWWLVAASILVAGLIGWQKVRNLPDQYTSTAVIQLVDSRDALTGGLVKGGNDRGQPEASTLSQVEIIRSRAVASAVLDSEPLGTRVETIGFPNSALSEVAVDSRLSALRLHLFFAPTGVAVGPDDTHPIPYGQPVSTDGLHFIVQQKPADVKEGTLLVQSRDKTVDDLLRNMDVAARKQTNIIDIAYTNTDPEVAQRVVNRVARVYQEINTRLAQQQLFRRRVFIQDQLARTDAQLAEADRALSTFRNQQQAYNSQEKFKSQQSALVGLDVRREELDGDRKMASALLKKFQTGDAAGRKTALSMLASAPEISGDRSTVPDLYKKLVDYQRQRAELTSGPAGKADTHPDVQRLDTLISSAEGDLVGAAQAHIALLDARIAALDEIRNKDAGALGQLPAAEAAETRLQQNADALRAQAASLRTEYQQARIGEAAEVGQVEIVDLATNALVSPSNGARVVLFALFLGLLVGTGLAVLLERTDHTIKRRDEVEHSLRVPVLGTVPRIDADEAGPGRFPRLPGMTKKVPSSSRRSGARATVVAATGSPAAQAFRQLSTNLLYSRQGSPARRILITSPTEGDGKTSIAANLAIAFAQQRHRVLLVDCDVYGKVHGLFQLPSSPGVSEVVLDGLRPDDAVRPSGVPGLSVMTSGKVADKTNDIIGSERMRAMLNDLAADFDMVILDCSPILALADSTILSVNSDAVLLVVRTGHTAAAAATEAMRHLATVGANVSGVVLNDPDERARQYGGGGYYYGYNYGYGRRS